MLYVYVTDQCLQDADKINTRAEIEQLGEKLTYEQSTLGLERHPYPFLKKRIGRTRVVMAEVMDGEDMVLCFLRHLYKKDIGEDYSMFFSNVRVPKVGDSDLEAFLARARATPLETKKPPSDLELEYLILNREQETGQQRVLESPLWINAIRTMKETQGKQGLLTPVWEVLQEICEDNSEKSRAQCERRHGKHNICVLFRYFPASNALFLIAPLEGTRVKTDQTAVEATRLLRDSADFDESRLLRNAARAYPDFHSLRSRDLGVDAGEHRRQSCSVPRGKRCSCECPRPDKAGRFPLVHQRAAGQWQVHHPAIPVRRVPSRPSRSST